MSVCTEVVSFEDDHRDREDARVAVEEAARSAARNGRSYFRGADVFRAAVEPDVCLSAVAQRWSIDFTAEVWGVDRSLPPAELGSVPPSISIQAALRRANFGVMGLLSAITADDPDLIDAIIASSPRINSRHDVYRLISLMGEARRGGIAPSVRRSGKIVGEILPTSQGGWG